MDAPVFLSDVGLEMEKDVLKVLMLESVSASRTLQLESLNICSVREPQLLADREIMKY